MRLFASLGVCPLRMSDISKRPIEFSMSLAIPLSSSSELMLQHLVERLRYHLAKALERDSVGAAAITPLLDGFFETAGSIVSNVV